MISGEEEPGLARIRIAPTRTVALTLLATLILGMG